MEYVISHRWLPAWLAHSGLQAPTNAPAELKTCLATLGVNNRTWKLYAEYGDGLLRPLGPRWLSPDSPSESLSNSLAYLRLLNGCDVDMPPPQVLVSALSECVPPGESLEAIPAATFRAAWRALVHATYQGISPDEFVREEFVPAMQWYFAERSSLDPEISQGKASWDRIRKQWREALRRRALPPPEAEWPAQLRGTTIGNFRFVPLRSDAALKDEGEVMRHCVANFGECCRKGCLQLFSIRNATSLDRIATLAARRQSGSWVLAQLRGDLNRLPDKNLSRVAAYFLAHATTSMRNSVGGTHQCEGCLG